MPVSDAWPERGASALKRLRTRLRNSLKKEMLESLLHIAINGPPVKESEAVINKAVELWKEKKKRKKTVMVLSSATKCTKCTKQPG